MTRPSPLARSRAVLRAEGLSGLVREVLAATVYRRMLVYERNVEDALRSDAHEGVSTRPLTDAAEYLRIHPDVDRAAIEARLLTGHRCLVYEDGGVPAGTSWAAFGRAWIEYLDCDIVMAADELYSYETFILPEMRGRRIAARTVVPRSRVYASWGVSRVLSCTHFGNRPALGMQSTIVGVRPIGVAGCWRIGAYRRPVVRLAPGERPVRLEPPRR